MRTSKEKEPSLLDQNKAHAIIPLNSEQKTKKKNNKKISNFNF